MLRTDQRHFRVAERRDEVNARFETSPLDNRLSQVSELERLIYAFQPLADSAKATVPL